MEQKYFLTEQDVRLLREIINREQKNPGRLAHDNPQQENNKTPDIYVAVPPCGQGIPARSGTVPGMQMCCLFKLVATNPSSGVAGFDYQLLPMIEPGIGSPVSRPVYNIYDIPIPPLSPPNEKYIRVEKDKFGRWLNEPWVFVTSSTTSTTTSSCSNYCSPHCKGNCVGDCKWIWNGTCWNKDTDTCGNLSTTTTTPSPCLCNFAAESTNSSSSTTSTTTTTSWCKYCSYPSFNGLSVNQCTFTYCSKYSTNPSSSVNICNYTTSSTTTTTTTSVDCHTTSTTTFCPVDCCGVSGCADGNCNGYCIWTFNPVNGFWTLSCAGCPYCGYPTGVTGDSCSGLKVPCANPLNYQTPPTTLAPCSGSVDWEWNTGSQCWTPAKAMCVGSATAPDSGGYVGGGCRGGIDCRAFPPTVDGTACQLPITTNCQETGTSTSTTPFPSQPWMQCYTTTTSTLAPTTTTCAGACGNCLWSYATSNWAILQNNCVVGCLCDAPTLAGQATCQVQDTLCSTTSTTTSSTTSTTTTTAIWYCCEPGDQSCGIVTGVCLTSTCLPPNQTCGTFTSQSECLTHCVRTTTSSSTTTTTSTTTWLCQSVNNCISSTIGGGYATLTDCLNHCTTTTTTTTTSTTTSSTTTTTTSTMPWWCCSPPNTPCATGPNSCFQGATCGSINDNVCQGPFPTQSACLAAGC